MSTIRKEYNPTGDISKNLDEILRKNGMEAHLREVGDSYQLLVISHDSPQMTYNVSKADALKMMNGGSHASDKKAYNTFVSIVRNDFYVPNNFVHAQSVGSHVNMEHLDKSASIPGLQASEILYKRIRELYLGGDSRVLPFLAEYHNSEDISFVISSLRKYKADIGEIDVDDEHYNSVVGAIAETVDNAIAAVVKWPDSAFVPVLEEMRNDGVLEGFHSYYRQMMFFEAAMAYDNDWAYNIIEDIFNKDYDDTSYLSSYPECLYRAYYEGEKRARFLPLVEKYGKESSVWDDWQ